MSTSSTSLSSFPEELLERILSLCISEPSEPPSRPSWHPATSSFPCRSRIAPLLVCKTWARIATPLVYHTLHINTPGHARKLARGTFGPCVRTLVVKGCSWPREMRDVARTCPRLETLDITLDAGDSDDDVESNENVWSDCLAEMNIKHLIVRKMSSAYLTQAHPRAVMAQISRAIHNWPLLHTVHIAFKLSEAHDFALALAHAPRLTSVLTQLPVVWNPTLLSISANPRLERIILNPEGDVVLGTGLFMMEAKKHARLMELVRAGTSIIRTRAHTMGTLNTSSSISSTASFASAQLEMNPPLREKPSASVSSPPEPLSATISRRWGL